MREHQATDTAWIDGLVAKHYAEAHDAQKAAQRREPTHLEIADYILSHHAGVDLREQERRKAVLHALTDAVVEYEKGLELAPPANQ